MREFKINRDKESVEPNEEQMKKYKDFASVSHGYQRLAKRPKKPIYKDPKLFLILVLLGVVFALVFNESEKEIEQQKNELNESKATDSLTNLAK